jgi:putative endonuclease
MGLAVLEAYIRPGTAVPFKLCNTVLKLTPPVIASRRRSNLFEIRNQKVSNKKTFYVYILFNKPNGTLYIGVTNDLIRRVAEHKKHKIIGFTQKYNVDKIGYFESFEYVYDAIKREKQLKAGPRKKKIELIKTMNPGWKDLFDEISQFGW